MDTLLLKIKKINATRQEMIERISYIKDEIAMCTEELAMCEEVLSNLNNHLDYVKGEQAFMVNAMAVAGAVKCLDSPFTDDDAYLYDVWSERIATSADLCGRG